MCQCQSLCQQHGKELPRTGNRRHRMQRLALQLGQGQLASVGAQRKGSQRTLHRKRWLRASGRSAARVQHKIHSAWPRLTQGPRGQEKAVANALVVEDADLQVALQRQVLQAIIADDHIGVRVGRQQGAGRSDTARGYEDRH